MKFTQLKDDLNEGARSVYLIEGDDAYFRMKAEEQIKEKFLVMPELNYASFDGSQLKGNNLLQLVSALTAYPFMAEKRIVKVSDLAVTESDYDKYLKSALENFPDTTILLIVNTQGKKGVDFKKKKFVTFVDCNRADRDMVAKWVFLTLKRSGISATVESCEAVADYCLCDMARVSRETEKLAEYCGGGAAASITKKEVDDLVYKDADYRVYQMTGAVARKDYGSFMEILTDLREKGSDENYIIATLTSYFKTLLTVAEADLTDGELMKLLNIKEYALGKDRQQAKQIGKDRLIKFINALYGLASQLKSGVITADGALESTVAHIFFD